MAKVKTVRQAYAVTLIVGGKELAPGTAVTLPQDEADKIAAMFGTIPAVRSEKAPAEPDKVSTEPERTVDLAALEKAVEEAQIAYDAAKALLEEPDVSDADLKVFEEAEARLDAAEQALADAGGE